MRLLGHLVTKNEADRYLTECLEWLRPIVDAVAVFDDASTDGTVQVCQDFGARVGERGRGIPTFLGHEGEFREAAWRFMEWALEPTDGDWVICIDADEFIVADGDERAAIEATIAEAPNSDGLMTRIPEVFGFDADGVPLIRYDGWWKTVTACRIVRWRPNGRFKPGLSSGSVPTSVRLCYPATAFSFLHYGYAAPEDRVEKHARYTKHAGAHNRRHVESIVAQPMLRRWPGKVPLHGRS